MPYDVFFPKTFPIAESVIAVYWDDMDLRTKGELRYSLMMVNESTGQDLFTAVNQYIRSTKDTSYTSKWILVAYWVDVCYYESRGSPPCTQVCTNLLRASLKFLLIIIILGKQFSTSNNL